LNLKCACDEISLVPPGVVTVTLTVPADPAGGDSAVIDVAEPTVKLFAALKPKLTAVAPDSPWPVIVTTAPPAVEPVLGESLLITGAGR